MEVEGEMFDPDAYAYPHEDEARLIDWKESIKVLERSIANSTSQEQKLEAKVEVLTK